MSAPDETAPADASTDEVDSFVRRVAGGLMRAPRATLVAGTIIDGTYRVVRRLGAGGMGVVYLAYDLRLKRELALKLHALGGDERLAREATAIAQLVHPNVVTVHQIGQHEDLTYVAMEYLDGGTARTWLADAPRTWREIVDVYVAAARGLAAAHDAGMVHRDFKPENLLMGRDGRVRVADFGLVRALDDGADHAGGDHAASDRGDRAREAAGARAPATGFAASSDATADTVASDRGDRAREAAGARAPATGFAASSDATADTVASARDVSGGDRARGGGAGKDRASDVERARSEHAIGGGLTETGAVLGTPAYMAPEQKAAGAVGPAADQYALCAALWEALYRERRIHHGGPTPPSDERGVPRRIRQALERGLATSPEARWPSMRALIAALSPPPRRRLAVVAGASVAFVALAGAYAGWPRAAADPCAGAAAAIDREVPAALVDGLRAAVAASSAAADLRGPLDARLARVRPELAAAATRVCRAGKVERTLAPAIVARAEACLTLRARATALLIDDRALAAADAATYATRLQAIPPLAACTDAVALAALPVPAGDAAIRARALLLTAGADVTAERPAAAADLLARARATAGADDRGAAALAQVVEARLALAAQQYDDAATLLASAYHAGQAIDDPTVYLAALTELILVTSGPRPDPTAATFWRSAAEAAVEKDRSRAPGHVAGVHAALSTAAARAGNAPDAAVDHAEQSLALRATLDDPAGASRAENVLGNALALAAGRLEESLPHFNRAIELDERHLGVSHPRTIASLSNLALTLYEGSKFDAAFAVADRLAAALAAAAPERTIRRANAYFNLGIVRGHAGDSGAARSAYAAARDIYAELEGADHVDVLAVDTSLAALDLRDGRAADALALLDRVQPLQRAALGGDHREVGTTQFNIATAALMTGDVARAEPAARDAVRIYTATDTGQRSHVLALALHAQALTRLGRARDALAPAASAVDLAAALGLPDVRLIAAVEVERANLALGRDPAGTRARLRAIADAMRALPAPPTERIADIDRLLAP